MCTMPSRPSAKADQPITWRPAGPLRSGSRSVRHPAHTRNSGTSQPTLPTAPAVTERAKSITPPGSCHHTAAAATVARPKRNSPTPSRRCSGSRSRADCPTERATAPRAWARPSHTAAIPRPTAPNERETGPGPLRTARGAGRDAGRREDALERLRPFADEEEGRLLVLRDRVLEPLVVRLVPDVLELRDPGGEDVRVAMVRPYGHVTPVTGTTRVRVVDRPHRAHPWEGKTAPLGPLPFTKVGRPSYGDPDHSGDTWFRVRLGTGGKE